MKIRKLSLVLLAACGAVVSTSCADNVTSRALDSIKAADMTFSMKFLGSPEFHGRNTPSVGLDIASKYIALTAERIGLKPLMPGGAYYQEVPVEVTAVAPCASWLRLYAAGRERRFAFPAEATVGRGFEAGEASGEIVFLGYGLRAPDLGWDDLAGIDLRGKVAVILETTLPEGHPLKPAENRRRLGGRAAALRASGAAAVVTIIGEEHETRLAQKGLTFDLPERLKFPDVIMTTATTPLQQGASFPQIEVRREAGAAILGWTREEMAGLSASLRQGRPVAAKRVPGRRLDIVISAATRKEKSFNVVAYLEGADPALRQEYLTLSSHHDHNPDREGRVFPGADDNISGVVGMFEIAEAMMIARPKRSVIFVWNTAEEKGLVGSYYFVQHCPVPVEKISANLDLDMISRNDTNRIYLIGSNKISSELDASIQAMNRKPGPGLTLDYKYEAPGHPDRFFFRSDQYPYIRYGIPAVWFFSGTTEDYHTEGDIEAKVDYAKMEKVCQLVTLVALDIGNKPALLKLDLRPEVRTRGPQNMTVEWR
jgi:Zn-dependent M28 family amino/carboxypeptidase